jgi:hypothetical protein
MWDKYGQKYIHKVHALVRNILIIYIKDKQAIYILHYLTYKQYIYTRIKGLRAN